MKRLREFFNSASFWDHTKGAVLGMSAGFALGAGQLPAVVAGGFMGLIMGAERITDLFNTAVQGHQMAVSLVPALVTNHAPIWKR